MLAPDEAKNRWRKIQVLYYLYPRALNDGWNVNDDRNVSSDYVAVICDHVAVTDCQSSSTVTPACPNTSVSTIPCQNDGDVNLWRQVVKVPILTYLWSGLTTHRHCDNPLVTKMTTACPNPSKVTNGRQNDGHRKSWRNNDHADFANRDEIVTTRDEIVSTLSKHFVIKMSQIWRDSSLPWFDCFVFWS